MVASEAVGVTQAINPDPHRMTSAKVETHRGGSGPPPSQVPRQPPIKPEMNYMGGHRATLRGRRMTNETTRRRPPTTTSIDQCGKRTAYAVNTARQAMRVPGQARNGGVGQGRGQGRGKPAPRWGLGRGDPPPGPGEALKNRPSSVSPPGPITPQAEWGFIMRVPPLQGARGCRTGNPYLRDHGR